MLRVTGSADPGIVGRGSIARSNYQRDVTKGFPEGFELRSES